MLSTHLPPVCLKPCNAQPISSLQCDWQPHFYCFSILCTYLPTVVLLLLFPVVSGCPIVVSCSIMVSCCQSVPSWQLPSTLWVHFYFSDFSAGHPGAPNYYGVPDAYGGSPRSLQRFSSPPHGEHGGIQGSLPSPLSPGQCSHASISQHGHCLLHQRPFSLHG